MKYTCIYVTINLTSNTYQYYGILKKSMIPAKIINH